MVETFRVIAFTFVGRQQTLSLLAAHMERQKEIIDEWVLCWNVRDSSDVQYIVELNRRLAPWTRIVEHRESAEYARFYKNFSDPDVIYVKIDDDIIWMEENALFELVSFVAGHPEYSVVSGNVINNVLMSHLHQRIGAIPFEPLCGWYAFDETALTDGQWIERVHRHFLTCIEKGDIERWKFTTYRLFPGERFSINCVSFRGLYLSNIVVDDDDEKFISQQLPELIGKPAVWFGRALFVHYSFGPQFQYIQKTDLLDAYRSLTVESS